MSKHEASAREHIFGRVPSATGAVMWHKNDQRVVTMCYEVAARVLDARSRDRISFAVARCDRIAPFDGDKYAVGVIA